MAENPIDLKDDPDKQLEYLASTTYLDRQDHEEEIEEEPKTIDNNKKEEEHNDLKALIKSSFQKDMNKKIELAQRDDLDESDYMSLFETGSKEVHIALAKNSSIPIGVAKKLLNSVYLAKTALFNNPVCDEEIKNELVECFKKQPRIYKEILEKEV